MAQKKAKRATIIKAVKKNRIEKQATILDNKREAGEPLNRKMRRKLNKLTEIIVTQ
jgi:hypothetical protein